jgi:molybdopterin/thiamine biosynthesis adenylyltransferase
METLDHFLRSHALGNLLPWEAKVEAATRFGLTYGAVEEAALEMNLLPVCYQENQQSITTEQQLRLLRSKVAVIGCGGLGGYAVEELARLGIGEIKVIDPDVIDEDNLNRQIYSSIPLIGRHKVDVAAQRVEEINPAVTVVPLKNAFTIKSGFELLQGIDVVVDGLDSIPTRLELADICNKSNIPLVHGSIAGWYGQVAVQFPGENTLEKIYSRCTGQSGIEKETGNLSFTPAVVASIEVSEVCKILLEEGTPLRRRMLSINLLDMEVVEVEL